MFREWRRPLFCHFSVSPTYEITYIAGYLLTTDDVGQCYNVLNNNIDYHLEYF